MTSRRRALAGGLALAAAAVSVAVVSIAVLLAVEPRSAEIRGSPDLGAATSPETLAAARLAVVVETNGERQRRRLGSLRRHVALERAASRHAADMLARDFFAHESPEGDGPRDRAEAAGYRGAMLVGETIAYGQRTASDVVADWLASPPHRKILLEGRFTEIGVGVAAGRHGRGVRITWVALLAAPQPPRR